MAAPSGGPRRASARRRPGWVRGADLEQRLAVALPELVHDEAPGRVGEGSEDVTHAADDMQVTPCMSRSKWGRLARSRAPPARWADRWARRGTIGPPGEPDGTCGVPQRNVGPVGGAEHLATRPAPAGRTIVPRPASAAAAPGTQPLIQIRRRRW